MQTSTTDISTPPIREAIILAGGLGTRLRSAVPELPKCMAPVAGRPFIAHVIEYCLGQGIDRFIFALGYKSDYFDEFLQGTLPPERYAISREDEPLGTGGAIRLAARLARDPHVLALNGDTFFGFDLAAYSRFHIAADADCSLCLKPMKDFDRYGSVDLEEDNRIIRFQEKKHLIEGLINAGVYALKTRSFLDENLPEKFSFEKDYLESLVGERKFYGLIQDSYFIDIGIPEDYQRAQIELAGPAAAKTP